MDSQVNHFTHRPPVVLQVIPELGPGGAEQGCIDVAKALVAAGGQALVASHGGSRVHELVRAGATHIDLPVHSKNPFVMMRNTRRLKRLIHEHRVDIVHARSRAPAWSAYKACQNTPARFMTTCHAPYNFTKDIKKTYNSVMAKGERVIAISHYVAEYLREHYDVTHDRLRVVHRGIPLEKFHPTMVTPERMITVSRAWRLPDEANIIMLPGRLTRWKGHHVLIEAMAHLARSDLFCVMIGSDQGRTEYRQELEETIASKGLGGQIRIVDHCDDLPAAFMLAAVVVSASTDPEGFGRVAVEGQAMGRPVIATAHGGALETVVDGSTGWLVPPGDARALAHALEHVLALNTNQRVTLATNAMAHVAAHFGCEHMTGKTLAVYEELLRL